MSSNSITVPGSGFFPRSSLACSLCLFASGTATWVSDGEVICSVPSSVTSSPSTFAVRVSNNGIDFSSSSATLTVAERPLISSLSPAAVPLARGRAQH